MTLPGVDWFADGHGLADFANELLRNICSIDGDSFCAHIHRKGDRPVSIEAALDGDNAAPNAGGAAPRHSDELRQQPDAARSDPSGRRRHLYSAHLASRGRGGGSWGGAIGLIESRPHPPALTRPLRVRFAKN